MQLESTQPQCGHRHGHKQSPLALWSWSNGSMGLIWPVGHMLPTPALESWSLTDSSFNPELYTGSDKTPTDIDRIMTRVSENSQYPRDVWVWTGFMRVSNAITKRLHFTLDQHQQAWQGQRPIFLLPRVVVLSLMFPSLNTSSRLCIFHLRQQIVSYPKLWRVCIWVYIHPATQPSKQLNYSLDISLRNDNQPVLPLTSWCMYLSWIFFATLVIYGIYFVCLLVGGGGLGFLPFWI